MSYLIKETCTCCNKNIKFSQNTLTCESCGNVIYTACYKNSNFVIAEEAWHCGHCLRQHTTRYNPFMAINNDGDDCNNNISTDVIHSLHNITNILNSCKSYNKQQFNNLLHSPQLINPKKNRTLFSMYFHNIDGNATNFDTMIVELHQLECSFSVKGLTETNCNPENKNLYNLQGYTSFYQSIMQNNGVYKKKGSGVALYTHEDLNAVLDTEKSIINSNIETLFINITNTPTPMTVGVVYRPPSGNIKAFIEHFNNIIQSLPVQGSYIRGDLNIDLHNPSHHGFHEYQNTLLSYNFSPLISIATRNKPGCKSSCIENMHTNSHESVLVSGIFSESVSHHSPIFQFSNVVHVTDNARNQHVQYYDFSRSNIECFMKKLSEVTSSFYTAENDFKTFVDIFTSSMNTTCKLSKPKTTKRSNINNPG